jgi:uncharacterized OB-fold protein
MSSALTQPFWAAAGQGKLVLQFDPVSGQPQFYPRPVGLGSGSDNLQWREVSVEGRIAAMTSLPGKTPDALAIVELDVGVRLLSAVLGDPALASAGARGRLVWLPRDGGPPMFAFEVR